MAEKNIRFNASKLTSKLPKEVKEKYKVVGLSNRSTTAMMVPNFGKVDFSKLTLKRAERLVKMKFPYLEAVSSKSDNKETKEGK